MTVPIQLPEVAIIDDSRALWFAWRVHLAGEAIVHGFRSPDAFWGRIRAEPELLQRIRAAIIDRHFPETQEDGMSLAQALADTAPHIRRILYTADVCSQAQRALFSLVIEDKQPVSLALLLT